MISTTFIPRGNPHPQRIGALTLALLLAYVSVCLCGCKMASSPNASIQSSLPISGTLLQGRVQGGQQPISGASIFLYAAGSTGPGGGAQNLLANHVVSTEASGYFQISGDYLCPTPATQVYLVSRGGNPGLASGANNGALVLMAALGDCGALTSSTHITVNEVTTVAAAWALSQFIGPGAIVGATSTNSAGLKNAFAVANNLVDTTIGLTPGSALPTSAVVESAKLNTLAATLAPCVNSDGGTACAPLFAAATSSSGEPADTLQAALNIVQHPADNIAAVFHATSPQAPFQPVLSLPPNDWTISITYGACTSGCGGLNLPGSVAVNSAGDVLVANYFGGVVSKFSPTGVPASPTGLPGVGLHQSYGIAVDGSDNLWVTNEQSVTTANNHHYGSISKFSSAGLELSGSGDTGGGIYYPLAAAADSNGSIWVADYGSSAATLLANDGSAISGSSGFGPSALPFTSAVALDLNHNAWFAAQAAAVRVTPTGVATSFPCCTDPAGIAVDLAGDVWIADYSASSIVELTSSGSVLHRTTLSGGNAAPQGIAIDGAGNVWAAKYFRDSLAELAGSTASVLSPPLGYGLDSTLNEPYGLAIDASGNLWLSNAGANTLTQFVGLAAPIKTPLLGPPSQP